MSKSLFAAKAICDNEEKRAFYERETTFPKFLDEVLNRLRKEEKAKIFLAKVTKKEAPDYYDVIKRPMDLGTMGKKVPKYRDIEEFKEDLDLIWSNCLKYNTAAYFVDCASEMKAIADSLLQERGRVYPTDLLPTLIYKKPTDSFGERDYKKWIAQKLMQSGFDSCEKRTLDILSDILAYKIMRELKKVWNRENLVNEEKVNAADQEGGA